LRGWLRGTRSGTGFNHRAIRGDRKIAEQAFLGGKCSHGVTFHSLAHPICATRAALRHTFLTEAGKYADAFTLQYVSGHDNIKTPLRYVHSREDAGEKLFVRVGSLPRS
jgi:hypothetical protein